MIPVPEARVILSLAATADGLIYGITNNAKVFVFDPEKKNVMKIFNLGFKEPREISLQTALDGKLYGLAKEAIFAIDPKNDQVSLLVKPSISIDSGMALLGNKIYYGSGANLLEFEIPAGPD
jgi:hypothetical protein